MKAIVLNPFEAKRIADTVLESEVARTKPLPLTAPNLASPFRRKVKLTTTTKPGDYYTDAKWFTSYDGGVTFEASDDPDAYVIDANGATLSTGIYYDAELLAYDETTGTPIFQTSIGGGLSVTAVCIAKNRHEQICSGTTSITSSTKTTLTGSSANVTVDKACWATISAYAEFNGNGAAVAADKFGVYLKIDGTIQAGTLIAVLSSASDLRTGFYQWLVQLSAASHTMLLQGAQVTATGTCQMTAACKWVLECEPVTTVEHGAGGVVICVDDPTQCCGGGTPTGSGSGTPEPPHEDIDCLNLPDQVRICITTGIDCIPFETVQITSDLTTTGGFGYSYYPVNYSTPTWSISGQLQCKADCFDGSPNNGKTALVFYGSTHCANSDTGDFNISYFPCVAQNEQVLTSEADPLHVVLQLYSGLITLDIAPIGTPCDTPPSGISRASLGSASIAGATPSIGINGITATAGSLVILHVAISSYDAATIASTPTFDGDAMTLDKTKSYTDASHYLPDTLDLVSAIYSIQVDVDTTGDILVVFSGAGANTWVSVEAVEVIGLVDRVLDETASASGYDLNPLTGSTPSTTTPDEYIQAGFALFCSSSNVTFFDASWAWSNGFTSGGQDEDNFSNNLDDAATEGYRVVSSEDNYEATLVPTTLDIAWSWAGVIVTYS